MKVQLDTKLILMSQCLFSMTFQWNTTLKKKGPQPKSSNEDAKMTLSVSEVSPYLESFLTYFIYLPFEEELTFSVPHATNEKTYVNPYDDRDIA